MCSISGHSPTAQRVSDNDNGNPIQARTRDPLFIINNKEHRQQLIYYVVLIRQNFLIANYRCLAIITFYGCELQDGTKRV
jgi:hypothetical protein